jgi:serine/threonine protein phosphatase 1
MRYIVSDVHGEYELFVRLLKHISFSEEDEMYICGDVIDKGQQPIRLAKLISSKDNIHCIIGNHEYAFLKYYHSILETSPNDFDEVLRKLQNYFSEDGHLLDWDLVDWFDELPSYIEEDEFICVHAGIQINSDQQLVSLDKVSVEQLVYDRRFKDPSVIHISPKCVFFGHTQTDCICGESKVLGYRRNNDAPPKTIKDYYKIHMDTGAWSNGVLGCVCIDTLKVYFVKK